MNMLTVVDEFIATYAEEGDDQAVSALECLRECMVDLVNDTSTPDTSRIAPPFALTRS